jgi:hypothetical protein
MQKATASCFDSPRRPWLSAGSRRMLLGKVQCAFYDSGRLFVLDPAKMRCGFTAEQA